MDIQDGVPDPFNDPARGHLLTRAVVDTIRDPLIILDEQLRIVAASHSFYKKFEVTREHTLGRLFYEIQDRQWDIPTLRTLLEQVIPEKQVVTEYEVEHVFPSLGFRVMSISARVLHYDDAAKKMLLSIRDITDQRAVELERERLLAQKDVLLREIRHRVANSLQLIANILLLKAEIVSSKESRAHLEDAHQRILSIAMIQKQLNPTIGEDINVARYLEDLCRSLSQSMIDGRKPITIQIRVSAESPVSSETAINFGLLTTELVINAIKHAFPGDRSGSIAVTYTALPDGSAWVLQVRDNGIGLGEKTYTGLGTNIIEALASQLQAIIHTESSPQGTTISIVHAAH